ESIPMKSLSCYNDYNSQVTCTWMEHSEAHALVGMILYQRNVFIGDNTEMFCKRQTENDLQESSDSYVHWVCQNMTDTFAIGVEDTYSFKPNKILQAELNVDLFQNVQTPPPQNLSVSLMTSGDVLLTWKAADGSQGLGNALEYEVTYKREWESWEVPGDRAGWKHWLRSQTFPGTYLALLLSEGGLQPRNLRCLFDGADHLTCSWEVRKAITTSVLFGLFFRDTPASAEEECSPVHEKALPHVPYVVQSCEIPVNNSSSQRQYHVSVRAKTEEKQIEAYKNIKVLPPANVSVTVTENQEYELRWTKYALRYSFIKQRYQVEYWKNNQYKNVSLESAR
ncbi:IL3RB protein, partial [Glareola pratincola]|nr:IL3RB protein [Glareola pratincola]